MPCTIKAFIKELEKYDENTPIFINDYDDDYDVLDNCVAITEIDTSKYKIRCSPGDCKCSDWKGKGLLLN